MSGALFIVDDQDLKSIDYGTQNLWFPGSLSDAQGGTITSGISGATLSFTFSGEYSVHYLISIQRNSAKLLQARESL